MKKTVTALTLSLLLACGGDEPSEVDTEAGRIAERETSASTPVGDDPTREEMERERFDRSWKENESLQTRRRSTAPRRGEYADLASGLTFVARGQHDESLEQIDTSERGEHSISRLVVPLEGDVSGKSVLAAQVLLSHAGFSPGVIDGRWGKNTETAAWWFQDQYGLEPTGVVDEETFRKLVEVSGRITPLQRYNVTSGDLSKDLVEIPDDVYEQADLDCLCYESVAEVMAEKFHTTPEFLDQLNGVNFASLTAGDQIWVPNVNVAREFEVSNVVVSVGGRYLHGEDEEGNITFHAPVTVGSEYDPSPTEKLKVVAIAFDPTFHYQPKLFHEVPDTEEDVILPPGPNSPVGKVWMELDKDNYGIHGTSSPSTIGYASSHGCIRLTNWDATALAEAISSGTPVDFTDPRG